MSEKSRTETVSKEQIQVAYYAFKEAQEIRQKIKELHRQLSDKLDLAHDSLQIVKQLRWGKDLVTSMLGKDDIYLADLLRLMDGDFRE